MTYILLVVLGVVWWLFIRTIGVYIANILTLGRWKSFWTIGVLAIGVLPPSHELYFYHRFKTNCEGKSGFTRNVPAQSKSIVFEGPDYFLKSLFLSPKVLEVVYNHRLAFEQDIRPTYADSERYLRKENCKYKGLRPDRETGLPSYWLSHRLLEHDICLFQLSSTITPEVRIERVWNLPGSWYYNWVQPDHYDFGYQLINEMTGEIMTEFKSISGPIGPFRRIFTNFGWFRYSCSTEILNVFSVPYDRDIYLEEFLDKAII